MLTLYFDYVSPTAALAVLRLEAAVARHPERSPGVAFVGIDPLGLDVAVPVTLDQRDEVDRVRDRVTALGLRMVRPSLRPPTVRAHLVGGHAERSGRGDAWRRACLHAYWERGADLHDVDVLVESARGIGLDGATVRQLVSDPGAVAAERLRTAARHRRGVGGVPLLELDGTFVGADVDDAALDDLVALAGGAA